MGEHWVPEDDRMGGGRPAIDDDTEGHILAADEQPGVAREGQQPDLLEPQDDDTEGHLRIADKTIASTDARDDEVEGPGVARY